jgi:hypothetical protein
MSLINYKHIKNLNPLYTDDEGKDVWEVETIIDKQFFEKEKIYKY